MNSIKIIIPEGHEIDKEKSTFEEIVFKKIKTKLYEILSVLGLPSSLNKDIKYQVIDDTTILNPNVARYCNIDLDDFPIYSIKRLSDGEIFTLGDITNKGRISKIVLTTTKQGFGINTNGNNIWFGQNTFQRIKPLLVTEDGVNLFQGDKYFTVHTKQHNQVKPFEVYGTFVIKYNYEEVDKVESCKYFSSRETAEDFILFNKPCLSLNELLSVWSSSDKADKKNFLTAPLFIKFKNIAKNK